MKHCPLMNRDCIDVCSLYVGGDCTLVLIARNLERVTELLQEGLGGNE